MPQLKLTNKISFQRCLVIIQMVLSLDSHFTFDNMKKEIVVFGYRKAVII